MPILQASGTDTGIIGTEQTLADLTTPFATFESLVDLSLMQAGDTVELRVYTKVLSTSNLNCCMFQTFSNAQPTNGGLVVISLPVTSDQEIKFTLKQTAGAPRNFDWKVISLP